MYLSRRYILIKLLVLIILFTNVVSGRNKRKAQGKVVPMPPEILPAALHYNVRLNDTVCLPCAFKIEYTGEYQILSYWQKSNSPVLGWPRYTFKEDCLEIKNIRSVDHGQYTCIAQSILGKTEALRILTVIDRIPGTKLPEPTSRPYMTKFPILEVFSSTINVVTPLVRESVAIGDRVKLRCRIDGNPTPKIYWLRNGRVVEKSDKFSLRPRKKLLVIKSFSKQEVGRYTCVGNNSDGARNMSFVVDAKEDVHTQAPTATTHPPQEVSEMTVRPGQNITLTCQAPVKKLTYLLWSHMSVSKKRRVRQHEVNRDFTLNKSKLFVELKMIQNGTRIQQYVLLNVSKAVHEGEYRCIGLFRKKSVLTVKVVKLKVEERKVLPIVNDKQSGSFGGKEEFPLNIVLPAAGVAFFLLVIFLCVCFVCRRKARHSKGLLLSVPTSSSQLQQRNMTEHQDDNDQMYMQILPVCNYDSLRKHTSKSSPSTTSEQRAESLKSNSSVRCHLVSSCETSSNQQQQRLQQRQRSHSAEVSTTSLNSCCRTTQQKRNQCSNSNSRKYSDTTTTNNSLCNKNASSSTSITLELRDVNSCNKNTPNRTDHETNVESISSRRSCDSKTWPGERLNPDDPEYMECVNENDQLFTKDCPTIERAKKYKIENCNNAKKETRLTNSTKPPCSRVPSNYGSTIHNGSKSCGVGGGRPLSTDSEEEDKLLQREIKNWEPLLRHSSTTSTPDSGGCSVRAL